MLHFNKENRKTVGNYREIPLMNTGNKILSLIRLLIHTDNKSKKLLKCIQENKLITDHIFVMRHIIENNMNT